MGHKAAAGLMDAVVGHIFLRQQQEVLPGQIQPGQGVVILYREGEYLPVTLQ